MTGACIHFLFFILGIPALTRRGFLLTRFLIFCIVYLALALLISCYYEGPLQSFTSTLGLLRLYIILSGINCLSLFNTLDGPRRR